MTHCFHTYKKRRKLDSHCASFLENNNSLLVVLGLENLAPTVEAVRADVVTQVRFASRRLDSQRRRDQKVVGAMHAALRRGFFVLLNSHDNS